MGNDILVTPIVDSSQKADILFPSGKWVDFWNQKVIFEGNTRVVLNYTSYETFPVFHRAGSILPLNITTDYVNLFGNSMNEGYLTLAIHYPIEDEEQVQVINSHGIEVRYRKDSKTNVMTVSISAPNQMRSDYKNMKYLLNIRGLLPTFGNEYKISQYSFYDQKYLDIPRMTYERHFTKAQTSYLQNEVEIYQVKSHTTQKSTLYKHQQVWIKVHDAMRGVKLTIQ